MSLTEVAHAPDIRVDGFPDVLAFNKQDNKAIEQSEIEPEPVKYTRYRFLSREWDFDRFWFRFRTLVPGFILFRSKLAVEVLLNLE